MMFDIIQVDEYGENMNILYVFLCCSKPSSMLIVINFLEKQLGVWNLTSIAVYILHFLQR
jgi:hypothetical protein